MTQNEKILSKAMALRKAADALIGELEGKVEQESAPRQRRSKKVSRRATMEANFLKYNNRNETNNTFPTGI